MSLRSITLLVLIFFTAVCRAQNPDSLPVKIKHAEPIFNDIVRDLGARKGEREFNVGYETEKNAQYVTQGGFIEYEFAPVNRLGLEIEVPFQFHSKSNLDGQVPDNVPRNKIEGVKPAVQYTFLVNEKARLSMAAGGIYELRLHSFQSIEDNLGLIKGNSYNPFFIAAKRWGRNLHTMLYMGPEFYKDFETHENESAYLLNLSMHYMVGNNFIGIEMNQEFHDHQVITVLRPQAKVQLMNKVAVGIASGIPIAYQRSGYSFIARMIYEL
jgi:hypothetical protein